MKDDGDLCMCGHARRDHCGCGCKCMHIAPGERLRAERAREADQALPFPKNLSRTGMAIDCTTCTGFRPAKEAS